MRKKRTLILGMIILLPQMIIANAGTPLMWVQMIHLVFGNLVLGIIEGLILKFAFKTKLPRAVVLMILANYVSWIIGTVLISYFQNTLINKTFELEYVYKAWIVSIILLYFVTVLIEAPFIFWIYRREVNFKKSLTNSFLINVLTYTGMIAIYLHSSGFNIFTDIKIDQSLLDNRNEKHIFYILSSDSKVYSYRLADKKMELLIPITSEYKYPRFELNYANDSLTINLGIEQNNTQKQIIDSNFCSVTDSIYYGNFNYSWWQPTSDFRDINDRTWDAYAGDWAIQGLRIRKEGEIKEKYAFEVPWMMWSISEIAIINNHELIFKINGRIVLLDIEKKEMAFICRANDFYIKRIVN